MKEVCVIKKVTVNGIVLFKAHARGRWMRIEINHQIKVPIIQKFAKKMNFFSFYTERFPRKNFLENWATSLAQKSRPIHNFPTLVGNTCRPMSAGYRLRGIQRTVAKMRRDNPFRIRYMKSVTPGRRRDMLQAKLFQRDLLRMRAHREAWMRGRQAAPLTQQEEEELQDYLDAQYYTEDLWNEEPE